MPNQVAPEEIQRRSSILRDLGKEKRSLFYARFLGHSMKVLVESRRDLASNLLKGFSRNYIPILLEGEDTWKNEEILIKIHTVQGLKVSGGFLDDVLFSINN
jgi:threonylcarbamoyladenosine tRNA methylthiotransferase MtaB